MKTPKKSYDEASKNLVFRLSELVFGSLLASYIIGFVGLSSGAIVPKDPEGSIVAVLNYVAISSSFAYLTAALYLSYHTGILTMPTVPLDRMWQDFSVALAQALLFGLAMLVPPLLGLSLALALGLPILRQSVEYRNLKEKLWKKCDAVEDDRERLKSTFYRKLGRQLADSELRVWYPFSTRLAVAVVGVFILGIAEALYQWTSPDPDPYVALTFNLMFAGAVFVASSLFLKDRRSSMSPNKFKKMKVAQQKLHADLKGEWKEWGT